MSDNAFFNLIIETLEKEQKVQIWSSQNPMSEEAVNKIMKALKDVKNQAIKEHILELFGPKPN